MRRWFMLALGLLTLLLVAAGTLLVLQRQAQPGATATVTPAELAAVRRAPVEELHGQLAASDPPLVWDFRPESTFADGHIPGARVLTLDMIPGAAAGLEKGVPIVTVCA